jgi:hypothetical protein
MFCKNICNLFLYGNVCNLHINIIQFFPYKICIISMCFVREWSTGLTAIYVALRLRLSENKVLAYEVGIPDHVKYALSI